MGLLWMDAGGRGVSLAARNLIGRGPECAVSLSDPRASGSHALLTWKAGRWLLRDLGSRNGTFLDGARLTVGEAVAVEEGATLRFGGAAAWVLREAGAPGPVATSGARTVAASQGMLVLPSEDDPQVIVYEDGEGGFAIDRDGGSGPLGAEEAAVCLGGGRWRLFLPPSAASDALVTTWDVSAQHTVESIGLALAVSQDEEHVDVTVRIGADERRLRPRVHHYLLLQLARARLSDAAAGLGAAEQGWVYAEDLCRQLRIRPGTLNLHMLRARRQLAEAGVSGAGRLFERRRLSGQVRLLPADVAVLP